MNLAISLILGVLFSFSELTAQSVSTIMGASVAGMGNITTFEKNDWSVFNNVAGLAQLQDWCAAASYEVRPALTAANRMAFLTSIPTSIGVFGGGIFRFGDDLYNEQKISAGFANRIGITSLGGRISYIQYRAEGFGTHGVIGLDFGGITRITQQFFIGAWIQNLNQPKINFNNQEKAPVKLYATLGFLPTEKFRLVTELEKDILYPAIWKTGMEYAIHKKLFIRTGLNVNPNAFFMGIGFNSWKIKIDYSLQSITQLKATHQASASYRLSSFTKSEK